jgi:hypothetical protein
MVRLRWDDPHYSWESLEMRIIPDAAAAPVAALVHRTGRVHGAGSRRCGEATATTDDLVKTPRGPGGSALVKDARYNRHFP